jgi:hypothetical protein
MKPRIEFTVAFLLLLGVTLAQDSLFECPRGKLKLLHDKWYSAGSSNIILSNVDLSNDVVLFKTLFCLMSFCLRTLWSNDILFNEVRLV